MGRRRRKETSLESVNLLELKPVRVASWKDVETRVVLERPRPTQRGLRTLPAWIAFALSARHIRLDEIGSVAWHHLDGEHTVAQVAVKLREQFGERVEPVEERLGQLVRLLRQEQLLAYPGWDGEPTPKPGPG